MLYTSEARLWAEPRRYGAITVAANWALAFDAIGACGSAAPPARVNTSNGYPGKRYKKS
jgi:hypothetical protein